MVVVYIIDDSMIKDDYDYVLTDSLNRKYIVKVRCFSSAKTSDMEYYITPTKRDFDPIIYILHVGTNDPTIDDIPEEIADNIVNIATSFKTENYTSAISIFVHVAIVNKKRREQLTNY